MSARLHATPRSWQPAIRGRCVSQRGSRARGDYSERLAGPVMPTEAVDAKELIADAARAVAG